MNSNNPHLSKKKKLFQQQLLMNGAVAISK